MEDNAERPAPGRGSEAADKAVEISQTLADTAEAIAETAEMSARVHDGLGDQLPAAAEHAERDRRLAAAERAAAAAHRRGEVPPDDVRRIIRDGGRCRTDAG